MDASITALLEEKTIYLCKRIGFVNRSERKHPFAQDLSDPGVMLQELETIAQTLQKRLERNQTSGRTLTLRIKFADYQQTTRSRTQSSSIRTLEAVVSIAEAIFGTINLDGRSVRLLGLSVSNLEHIESSEVTQLPLFSHQA